MKELLFKSEMELVDNNKCRYKISDRGDVMLHLPTGNRRRIGTLTMLGVGEDAKLVYLCYRKKEIHLMRVNNSYGINEFILNKFTPDEIIFIIEDTGEKFSISKARFDEKSAYLHFLNAGFELQRFIALEHLTLIN